MELTHSPGLTLDSSEDLELLAQSRNKGGAVGT